MENKQDFKGKVAVVTGAARGIGLCIADEFRRLGAHVCTIDILPNDFFVGDLADKSAIEAFVQKILERHGTVDFIVNNALPLMRGMDECTYDEFQYALSVGVTAPFYLVKLLSAHLAPGCSIVNISSTRARMSQPQTESYSAAKGGISALTHAMAQSLAGVARINSIAPGWIDTVQSDLTRSDKHQHPVQRVGKPSDIANMVMYLCSEQASFITGQEICVDGGMSTQMIYHNDNGWTLTI